MGKNKRKKRRRKNNIKIRNDKWYNIFIKNLSIILLLANIDEYKYNFNNKFKLELVITFYIRFCYDSCESIAKNILNVTLFCWKI